MTDELRACVDKLYRVFDRYRQTPMDYCPCCVNKQEYARLLEPKLEDVGHAPIDHYVFNAIHTWGDVDGFKRFLPRIYEALAFERHEISWCLGMWLPIRRLGDAKWDEWPKHERQPIERYLRVLWSNVLDGKPAQPDDGLATDAKEVFEGLAVIYSDVGPFLDVWREKAAQSLEAADRLAQFVRYNEDFFWNGESLGTQDWSPGAAFQVREWLRDPSLSEALAAWLADCDDETTCWSLREALVMLEPYQERQ
jgi:hypothetical protein